MRQVAVHKIYYDGSHILSKGVAVIDGEQVVKIFPLTEEIESTEWIGGVIFLSHYKDINGLSEVKTIKDALEIITNSLNDNRPLYAWHASKVDLAEGLILPGNKWTRLRA